MVFNDSKVIPARLFGKRGEGKIEVLLHKKIVNDYNHHNCWQCFVKPAKRLKIGDIIVFAEDFLAIVLQKYADGQVLLHFNYVDEIFWQKLEKYVAMPLPPYIERVRHAEAVDNQNYQTIYAKHAGSVAAPTAGLHFTEELLAKIDALGVKRVLVTLHVGGGTFLPVKVEDTENHQMHSEFLTITQTATDTINAAKKAGGRVLAVGTTSVRSLESATDANGILHAYSGETSIFITPSYRFKLVDLMLTNFHLPKSTLFMLVSAFAGLPQMQAAYAYAITQKYRFYSYGDACLLKKLEL
jgi:S-adenosylmethionine:tRNA ribosyltransferase-isomerase